MGEGRLLGLMLLLLLGYLPVPAVAVAVAVAAAAAAEKFLPASGGGGGEWEMDELVAVGELAVEGGGESGGLEGGGKSDGRNFSVFRRGGGNRKGAFKVFLSFCVNVVSFFLMSSFCL